MTALRTVAIAWSYCRKAFRDLEPASPTIFFWTVEARQRALPPKLVGSISHRGLSSGRWSGPRRLAGARRRGPLLTSHVSRVGLGSATLTPCRRPIARSTAAGTAWRPVQEPPARKDAWAGFLRGRRLRAARRPAAHRAPDGKRVKSIDRRPRSVLALGQDYPRKQPPRRSALTSEMVHIWTAPADNSCSRRSHIPLLAMPTLSETPRFRRVAPPSAPASPSALTGVC
jgi:hypothetical protein